MADEPQDQSHLDLKYFIDPYIYNCPYCNRRHVTYELRSTGTFNWTATKRCACYFVRCRFCENTSMHLSFEELREKDSRPGYAGHHLSHFRAGVDIDSKNLLLGADLVLRHGREDPSRYSGTHH